MPEETEKLYRFTETVLRDAARESNELRRRLHEERAAILDAARAEAREAARAHYDREAARIRSESGREISRHLMDVKRQIYLRRKEIGAQVIDRVGEKIAAFTATPDYPLRLEAMLRFALEQLPEANSVQLVLREEDLQYAPRLAAAVAPVAVECVAGALTLGGMLIRCPQLGLRIDCSFDSRLTELSGHFAEQFGLSLSDDLDVKEESDHE